MDEPTGLVSHEKAAAFLDISPATLHAWNSRGVGPRSYRLGKHRKYRLRDLELFIEQKASTPHPAA